jgi:hypothetical protein
MIVRDGIVALVQRAHGIGRIGSVKGTCARAVGEGYLMDFATLYLQRPDHFRCAGLWLERINAPILWQTLTDCNDLAADVCAGIHYNEVIGGVHPARGPFCFVKERRRTSATPDPENERSYSGQQGFGSLSCQPEGDGR